MEAPGHPGCGMIGSMADKLELRPPGEDDLAIIEALTQDPDMTGEFAWFGWFDPLRWRRRWATNGLIDEDGGVLMIVLGRRPLGFVSWRRHPAAATGLPLRPRLNSRVAAKTRARRQSRLA